jgi:hypothetical protein
MSSQVLQRGQIMPVEEAEGGSSGHRQRGQTR